MVTINHSSLVCVTLLKRLYKDTLRIIFRHALKPGCRNICLIRSLYGWKCCLSNPSFSIFHFLLPSGKIFCLWFHFFISYTEIFCRNNWIQSYLDSRMDFVFLKVFEHLIGIICTIGQNRLDFSSRTIIVAFQKVFKQFIHNFSFMHSLISKLQCKDFFGLCVTATWILR